MFMQGQHGDWAYYLFLCTFFVYSVKPLLYNKKYKFVKASLFLKA